MSEARWCDYRVFVTGATGMVGGWLVKELIGRRAHVVVLIRDYDPRCELIRSGTIRYVSVVSGALEDFSVVRRAIEEQEVDTVFHLGAQTIVQTAVRNPLSTMEANVRGSYHVLEACRLNADIVKRVVIASSDKAYGSSPSLPYTEDMPLVGRGPYEASKSCADLLAQAYHSTYRLPLVIARCGNVYGGGDLNWSRIVPGTIRSLLQGERPVVRSDGRSVRDYIFVRDVALAYIRLAEAADNQRIHGEAFNFGHEQPVQVLEIVAKIRALLGREDLDPVVLGGGQGEIQAQYLSAAKAARVLGWRPVYTLDDGLRETIEWYRAYLGALTEKHSPHLVT